MFYIHRCRVYEFEEKGRPRVRTGNSQQKYVDTTEIDQNIFELFIPNKYTRKINALKQVYSLKISNSKIYSRCKYCNMF